MIKINKQIKIVLMFSLLLATSFLGDFLHGFLGDWYCNGGTSEYYDNKNHYSGCMYLSYTHEATCHYGFRHWVLIIMGLFLFFYNFYLIFIRNKENF